MGEEEVCQPEGKSGVRIEIGCKVFTLSLTDL